LLAERAALLPEEPPEILDTLELPEDFEEEAFEDDPCASAGGNEGSPLGPLSMLLPFKRRSSFISLLFR
jgi:hypothetical protein